VHPANPYVKSRFVKMDTGNRGTKMFGMTEAIDSVEDAAAFVTQKVGACCH
jgi:hypothetical protein